MDIFKIGTVVQTPNGPEIITSIEYDRINDAIYYGFATTLFTFPDEYFVDEDSDIDETMIYDTFTRDMIIRHFNTLWLTEIYDIGRRNKVSAVSDNVKGICRDLYNKTKISYLGGDKVKPQDNWVVTVHDLIINKNIYPNLEQRFRLCKDDIAEIMVTVGVNNNEILEKSGLELLYKNKYDANNIFGEIKDMYADKLEIILKNKEDDDIDGITEVIYKQRYDLLVDYEARLYLFLCIIETIKNQEASF